MTITTQPQTARLSKRLRGFTLVELLIVLMVLAGIVTLVLRVLRHM